MAKFKMTLIKEGTENDNNDYRYYAAVEEVILEEGDEELRFPETYEGLPVTRIGCTQGYKEAHIEYGDWHHPTHRPDEYVPARFFVDFKKIFLPPSVKRVYLHASITVFIVYTEEGTVFEIHPDNQEFALRKDGTLTHKCFL